MTDHFKPLGTLLLTLDVEPMGAPRMTRRDTWKRRPVVERYWAFRDTVREQAAGFTLPDGGLHLVFTLAPPASWSAKRKAAALGTPHRHKPDSDNMLKAVLDALCEDDKHIWDVRVTKVYGDRGRIEVWGPQETLAIRSQVR